MGYNMRGFNEVIVIDIGIIDIFLIFDIFC